MRYAVIYVRVSTEEQTKGFSLDGQINEVRRYLERKGYTVYEIYIDDGYSGKDFERPAVQKMFRDMQQGKFEAIAVWKVDRLSRSNNDVLTLINHHLKPNDLKLLVSTCDIDSSTTNGYMFISLLSTFAEYERAQIIDRVNNGMQKRAENGKWNGGIILGYDIVEKQLVINTAESQIVQKIFDLRAEGKGYKFIAHYLNNSGMKTKKGNHFSINTVKTILENATYTGQIEWGKHREWERKRRKGRQEEYCIVKGEHQPIITMELWNQVQNINAEQNRNNITYSNFKGDFILAGILKCPSCGAGTVMTKAKKRNKEGYHLYYMCQNYHSKGITACSSNLIKKELIEEKVLAGIQGLLTNPQIVENICIALNTEKNEGIEDLQVHLSIAKTELRKVEKLKRDTEGYYLNGDLDVRVYNTTMISALENEERIRSQIEQIQKSISTHTSVFQISREFIIEALKDFNNLFETADNEMKRALLRSLIKSIEVESNRKDIKSIVFWFTEDDTFTKFVLPENELR